jgi:hypothetical protein
MHVEHTHKILFPLLSLKALHREYKVWRRTVWDDMLTKATQTKKSILYHHKSGFYQKLATAKKISALLILTG